MTDLPTYQDILRAADKIAPYAIQTPIKSWATIDDLVGAFLFFKCENFQKMGAFKFRGACNAVMSLSEEEASRGVATHSSGNHAAAVALAAKLRGINALIVTPKTTSDFKINNIKKYGGEIVFCEPTLASRETTLAKIIEKTGHTEIHSYNDPLIIAGQGTAALEFLEEVPDLDLVLVPVGGGGLLSGTALSVNGLSLGTKVIGTEPAGADDAYRSFREGRIIPSINPKTICDGLLTSLGTRTFAIIQKHVHDIVRVSEEKIINAMRLIYEKTDMLIEPSSAVPLGALLEKKIYAAGKRIGIILSGGNIDPDKLSLKG